VPTKRFWQWNRYTPVVTSNAAMRDGDWKLVRPALNETMFITREDGEMDGALKYQPETITDICRDPEPERVIPAPPPPLLYNVADDPLEREDVAAREPDRIRRMLRELETWFEVVEADRIAGLAES
jgi:arylsulfatase A